MRRLNELFDPRTIALVGASEREGSVGKTILENLLASGGDRRKIFPVNPRAETLLGTKTYATIDSIPEPVDMAVISTPAPSVPGIVDECGKAGVPGLVIISAGFRETGEEGKRLEDEIEMARRRYGIRIVGPNCLGFMRPVIGLNATFIKAMPE
jgi:acetyltransferase